MAILSFSFYKKVTFTLMKDVLFHYLLETISESEEDDSEGK